jgi:hypothetical protein
MVTATHPQPSSTTRLRTSTATSARMMLAFGYLVNQVGRHSPA